MAAEVASKRGALPGREGAAMNRPEQALQRTIVAGLRAALPSEWVIAHYPSGGYRKPVEGAIFKAMGTLPGFPDILVFGEAPWGATCWFLEVKAEKGYVTSIQKACH